MVSKRKLNVQRVCLGSRVTLVVNGLEQEWEIVQVGKSKVEEGSISIESPLAKLIFCASAGDIIKSKLVGKDTLIEVKKVKKIES